MIDPELWGTGLWCMGGTTGYWVMGYGILVMEGVLVMVIRL